MRSLWINLQHSRERKRGERRLDVVEFLEVARALGAAPCQLLRKLEQSSGAMDVTQ
jgi:hypothetical protein